MDARKAAMFGAPLVAVATVALGLRIGAGNAVRAAVVSGAPRARGATPFAWQVATFEEDRGVREAVAVRGLTVTARAQNGAEAVWRGESNSDGIAEARLDLPSVKEGDPVTLEVRADGQPAPLAKGAVTWDHGKEGPEPETTFVRPTRREGEIALDVAVYGERLTPGYPTPIWVRATNRDTGQRLANLTIDAEPEPGLTVTEPRSTTCNAGYAMFSAVAIVHVTGIALHARSADGKTGDFFAGLPVAAGAYSVPLPTHIPADTARTVDIVAPNARTVVYAEIDDAKGRVFAAALPLKNLETGVPSVGFDIPALAKGRYWLTTSGDPHGAEEISGATVARPFWAGDDPGTNACEAKALLAGQHARGFRRWVALDGFDGVEEQNAARRGRGVLVAVAALAVAAALEALLIITGARRAKRDLDRASLELDGDEKPALGRRSSAGSLAIGLLVAVLGFALLASLLIYRG